MTSGFIYVAMNGMNDVAGLGLHGSWNTSRSSGPLGVTCDLEVLGEFPCYRWEVMMKVSDDDDQCQR